MSALDDDLAHVDFPLPSAGDQIQLWRRALPGDPDRAAEGLSERFSLTPGAIFRAAEQARREGALGLAGGEPAERLARAVRRSSELLLARIAQPFSTTLDWGDAVLPASVDEKLQEILASLRHRRRVHDDWGFRRKLSYGGGLSCLFAGPPGTGKTMMASVLAKSVGRELYRVDLSQVVSKWIGETEKNLATLFDEAQRAQVILLFDEADSLFSTRTEVSSSNDRFANMEINYLLQRMETFDGMTILTTNMAESIDAAFKRRIRYRVEFPFPDAPLRESLWRSMFPPEAEVAADIDFADLAQRFDLAGGSIKSAVVRAAVYAAEAGGPITAAHLVRAAAAEAREMGRLVREDTPPGGRTPR